MFNPPPQTVSDQLTLLQLRPEAKTKARMIYSEHNLLCINTLDAFQYSLVKQTPTMAQTMLKF